MQESGLHTFKLRRERSFGGKIKLRFRTPVLSSREIEVFPCYCVLRDYSGRQTHLAVFFYVVIYASTQIKKFSVAPE
jgi:hypothetical protein